MPDHEGIKFKEYYLGVKVVSAEQTSLINERGYRVKYSEGDSSWLKEDEFNKMYIPLGKSCEDISDAQYDKIVEYFIRNLRVVENFDNTIYSMLMPGGRIQNFDSTYDKKAITAEVKCWINFMLDWAIKGLDRDNNFIPAKLNSPANYYLGAKIVQAKKSNNDNIFGYVIRYPEGDIGWIEEENFNKIYIYIGDKKDIYNLVSKDFISNFNIYKGEINIEMALNFIRELAIFGIKEIKPYNKNLL